MRYLLDVNVLVALCDPIHPNHDAAHRWLAASEAEGFATCTTTENALVRILAHARFGTAGTTVADAVDALRSIRAQRGHRVLVEDLSLAATHRFDARRIHGAKQVTDVYLLGLAVEHGMRFATFDKRLNSAPVTDGASAVYQISPT